MRPTACRLITAAVLASSVLLGAASSTLAVCGPFTDVSDAAFCPFVLEIFTLGITTGTTPTTYDPATTVNRLQMAGFLSRTVDASLKRRGRRALLGQFWTTNSADALGVTTVGSTPLLSAWDGLDIWVANSVSGTVGRVRSPSGDLLNTWTGAADANGVLAAMGQILVTGAPMAGAGSLYSIDPSAPAGAVTTVASTLGNRPVAISFDGTHVWTANVGGSVSRITPKAAPPWTVSTVTTGFSQPSGMVFDGANIWVADLSATELFKIGPAGGILQTVALAGGGRHPAWDGTNIWVPCGGSNSVTVVRASTGAVLGNLTGNGLNLPIQAAFDGERVLVTNYAGNSVSLWKAADLSPIATISTGAATGPWGVSSDGVNFFLSLSSVSKLARF